MDYIIGVDYAGKNSKDNSAYSLLCTNCRSVIKCETFDGEEIKLEIPVKCKNCGTQFNNGRIIKEGE